MRNGRGPKGEKRSLSALSRTKQSTCLLVKSPGGLLEAETWRVGREKPRNRTNAERDCSRRKKATKEKSVRFRFLKNSFLFFFSTSFSLSVSFTSRPSPREKEKQVPQRPTSHIYKKLRSPPLNSTQISNLLFEKFQQPRQKDGLPLQVAVPPAAHPQGRHSRLGGESVEDGPAVLERDHVVGVPVDDEALCRSRRRRRRRR